VRVDAILPGHAMGTCGRWVLAVLVMLLSHLFQFVLPLAVFGVLVLFSLPWRPVFPQVLQLPKHAFGMCAPRLDVLEHYVLDLLAHGHQLVARGDRRVAPPAVQNLLDGGVAFLQVRTKRLVEIGRRRRGLRRRAHVGQRGGVATPWGGRGLRAGLCLALAADIGGRHGGVGRGAVKVGVCGEDAPWTRAGCQAQRIAGSRGRMYGRDVQWQGAGVQR
jgi:hypothetical protein